MQLYGNIILSFLLIFLVFYGRFIRKKATLADYFAVKPDCPWTFVNICLTSQDHSWKGGMCNQHWPD